MTARKSGNHIYVEGTGNTLASVVSDINDPTYCTWDATTNTFTVIGSPSKVRYFYIRNKGVLSVSDGETLGFNNASTDDTRFYILAGGIFNMSGNSVLDGRLVGQRPNYWYWYGQINIIGDGTNNPLIQGYKRIYLYETSNGNSYPNDVWTFKNLTIGSNGSGNNNYCFFIQTLGKIRSHVFENITMDDRIGRNYDTYLFAFQYGASQNAEAMTFKNINYIMGERAIQNLGGFPVKFSNNIYNGGSTSWSALHYGSQAREKRNVKTLYGNIQDNHYGQSFIYHENDEWTIAGNANCVLVGYGAVALFKNCTFSETSGDAIEAAYQGRAMIWTGNTFADSTWYDVRTGGEIAFVYGCSVNVKNENGIPIKDAVVILEQMEGKEKFHFYTNADGNLAGIHGLNVALLTYQSRWGNSTGNIETWSDGTGNKKHKVTVLCDGYEPLSQEVVMDQDRDIEFQFTTEGKDFTQSDIIKI